MQGEHHRVKLQKLPLFSGLAIPDFLATAETTRRLSVNRTSAFGNLNFRDEWPISGGELPGG